MRLSLLVYSLGCVPFLSASAAPSLSERAEAVKEAFLFSWDGYMTYAFPHDELYPVTNGSGDSRNGWGASAVDALSTALLMQLPDVVEQILDHIETIDYSTTNTSVSLFETTIRYLGGMLAGYDLLTGPFADLAPSQDKVAALLTQSKNLADNLKYAFDTPTGIPYNNLWFTNQSNDGSLTNGLATIGTLALEWTRLSDLLGDDEYANLSQRAESYLLDPKPAYNEPFPGLVGTNVAIANGSFVDATGGWSGSDDSFYEYLLKLYVYDPVRFEKHKDRWVTAANSTMIYLTSHPAPRPNLTFVAEYRNRTLSLNSGHLTCFDGGNFILGGQVLGREDLVQYGLELVSGCRDIYAETATHIGPERFGWDEASVPAASQDFYDRAGFYITSAAYILRPEVMESYYYAYRATGDPTYQDWAWDAFVAINATARVGSGFAGLADVDEEDGGGYLNYQESFWFAECLKYSWAIFAPDAEWQVSSTGQNTWVFNTEAHPLRVWGDRGSKR